MKLDFLAHGRDRVVDFFTHFAPWPPAAALLLPLVVGLLLLPLGIGLLARLGMGQRVRVGGPDEHHTKAGTPTAGGLIIIALVLLAVLFIDRRPEVVPVLAAMILGGGLGLVDDIATVRGAARGLLARQRIVAQGLIGVGLAYWFFTMGMDTQVVPLVGTWHMGWLIVPVGAVALVSAANAFNLTDGSDGLAAGVMVLVALVLALIVRNRHDIAIVRLLLATAGALLAFLVYNLPPARVFMGGVGSEGIGMLLAAASIAGGLLWFLPLLALVPAIETLSVIVQVVSFKTRGKRVFKMAPLHHHFQVSGWGEWTVALAGWAATSAVGTLGLLLARRAG
ncbi:MAG: phospho-N-acetylmuramoyl-pentapeptide-transferase [Candidatus Dormibacteraeota bacterium]|nr:phospho-N-acetylmuramoyl-pentapeptide-transferase [Candidatus Dormibacteraeota bacterium]